VRLRLTVRQAAVTDVVHDDTSVLATREAKWNLPAVTRRDANATTVMDFLNPDHTAFATPPEIQGRSLTGPCAGPLDPRSLSASKQQREERSPATLQHPARPSDAPRSTPGRSWPPHQQRTRRDSSHGPDVTEVIAPRDAAARRDTIPRPVKAPRRDRGPRHLQAHIGSSRSARCLPHRPTPVAHPLSLASSGLPTVPARYPARR